MISHLCHITYVSKGLKGRQAQFISTIVIFKKNLHELEIDTGDNYIKINKKR